MSRQAKKQEHQDDCDRNAVDGIFGTGKTAYGLGRIMAHPQETAVCVALLLLNLSRSLMPVLALFCLLSVFAFLPGLWSRAEFVARGPPDACGIPGIAMHWSAYRLRRRLMRLRRIISSLCCFFQEKY
ncbi:MAG: hypothetical protein HDT14_10335 [Oscillibacter sp.]|nr:hypothetical protein [Oscillibacter sp.]